VTDSSNSNPIAGAKVDVSSGGQSFGSDHRCRGHYSIQLPVGTYDATYSAFGYATDHETGIAITDGNTTTVDVASIRPR
jgi:hypothetical protein